MPIPVLFANFFFFKIVIFGCASTTTVHLCRIMRFSLIFKYATFSNNHNYATIIIIKLILSFKIIKLLSQLTLFMDEILLSFIFRLATVFRIAKLAWLMFSEKWKQKKNLAIERVDNKLCHSTHLACTYLKNFKFSLLAVSLLIYFISRIMRY